MARSSRIQPIREGRLLPDLRSPVQVATTIRSSPTTWDTKSYVFSTKTAKVEGARWLKGKGLTKAYRGHTLTTFLADQHKGGRRT